MIRSPGHLTKMDTIKLLISLPLWLIDLKPLQGGLKRFVVAFKFPFILSQRIYIYFKIVIPPSLFLLPSPPSSSMHRPMRDPALKNMGGVLPLSLTSAFRKFKVRVVMTDLWPENTSRPAVSPTLPSSGWWSLGWSFSSSLWDKYHSNVFNKWRRLAPSSKNFTERTTLGTSQNGRRSWTVQPLSRLDCGFPQGKLTLITPTCLT